MDKLINLELNVNEVNLLLQALQELPYRVSNQMIRKITEQAQAQVAEEAPEVDLAPKE